MGIRRLTQKERQRVYAVLQSESDVSTLATSEELHQLAWNYNWDDGIETMRQIIVNPLCDKATALMIYWRSSPDFAYEYATREEVPEWVVDAFDLAKEIESRYESAFYTQDNFLFDPHNDDGTNYWEGQEDDGNHHLKQKIPTTMLRATQGIMPEKEDF